MTKTKRYYFDGEEKARAFFDGLTVGNNLTVSAHQLPSVMGFKEGFDDSEDCETAHGNGMRYFVEVEYETEVSRPLERIAAALEEELVYASRSAAKRFQELASSRTFLWSILDTEITVAQHNAIREMISAVDQQIRELQQGFLDSMVGEK